MAEQLVGKSYKFDLGPLKVTFTFDSQSQGSFFVEEGGGLAPDGYTETMYTRECGSEWTSVSTAGYDNPGYR